MLWRKYCYMSHLCGTQRICLRIRYQLRKIVLFLGFIYKLFTNIDIQLHISFWKTLFAISWDRILIKNIWSIRKHHVNDRYISVRRIFARLPNAIADDSSKECTELLQNLFILLHLLATQHYLIFKHYCIFY